MGRCLCACVLGLVLAGCGNPAADAVKKMGGGPAPVDWPALDTLQEEALMAINYPLEQDDVAGAKKAAVQDSVKAAIDEFEKAQVPAKVDAAQKDAIVKGLKAVMEAAKGDDAAFKQAVDALNKAVGAVQGE